MRKTKLSILGHHIITGFPLVGVIILTLLPVSILLRHALIGITLLWLQVFILFEVFSVGTKI